MPGEDHGKDWSFWFHFDRRCLYGSAATLFYESRKSIKHDFKRKRSWDWVLPELRHMSMIMTTFATWIVTVFLKCFHSLTYDWFVFPFYFTWWRKLSQKRWKEIERYLFGVVTVFLQKAMMQTNKMWGRSYRFRVGDGLNVAQWKSIGSLFVCGFLDKATERIWNKNTIIIGDYYVLKRCK